jgi:cytochrome c peroxidase
MLMMSIAFTPSEKEGYSAFYRYRLHSLANSEQVLLKTIESANLQTDEGLLAIKNKINAARFHLKAADFWLRYLEPTTYHKINGPLPVEWETEVFEKYENPYKREGAGLTLAAIYANKKDATKDSLLSLIKNAVQSINVYTADSVAINLEKHHHFFLANRLFLLNLASIYTTGFECPDTERIIPELQYMLESTNEIYSHYNHTFPTYTISSSYLELYKQALLFVQVQPKEYTSFDQFSFIKNYVNPLFALNQKMIRDYNVVSNNFNDYALSNDANSIFSKSLYQAQNSKGIFIAVEDEETMTAIRKVGKLLFYDPILSGNNKRSCATCHNPSAYFTDTSVNTNFAMDKQQNLARNTPSLINAVYNHLLMADGKHYSLIAQGKDVITNPAEMGSDEKEVVAKVMSCKEYNTAFKKFVHLTPNSPTLSLDHIVSAIIVYYSSFSHEYAPFDDAMNGKKNVDQAAARGFNIFMSKAKCGTCHFVPQFNGTKPPFISTEFEVLGMATDTTFKQLSTDIGRAGINPVYEMDNAFRTGTIRNAYATKPYMHNGIFNTLEQVIDFYNAGGGAGKGLKIKNQTLDADSLHLSAVEKKELLVFIQSLNEDVAADTIPLALPVSKNQVLNNRKPGGEY